MAKDKYDVVIEAVHYNPDGSVDWVRGYQRFGSAFTDRLIWKREELVAKLEKGEIVYVGKRIPLLAGTFEVSEPVRLDKQDGQERLVVGQGSANGERLEGVPVI